jgi:hypothetical protein
LNEWLETWEFWESFVSFLSGSEHLTTTVRAIFSVYSRMKQAGSAASPEAQGKRGLSLVRHHHWRRKSVAGLGWRHARARFGD